MKLFWREVVKHFYDVRSALFRRRKMQFWRGFCEKLVSRVQTRRGSKQIRNLAGEIAAPVFCRGSKFVVTINDLVHFMLFFKNDFIPPLFVSNIFSISDSGNY